MVNKVGFPGEAWTLTETEYNSADLERNASLFFLGNGYLGLRGGFEEDGPGCRTSCKGTFINGFYESGPQFYGESAYGFPDKKQAMLNLPDPTGIKIFLDNEIFTPDEGKLLAYKRQLRLKEGILVRELHWESPGGRRMKLKVTRCVSIVRSHIAVISCEVSSLEGVESFRIVSGCNTTVISHQTDKSDPRTGAGFHHSPLECIEKKIDLDRAVVLQKTLQSGLQFAEVVSNSHCAGLQALMPELKDDGIDFHYEGQPSIGPESYTLEKYICFHDSINEALVEIDNAEKAGIAVILKEQADAVGRFWRAADIAIDPADAADEAAGSLQQGIRFNLFSIYQSAGRDGLRNIAAKGLSGEGYEGHYFWDTEIYVIPFFTYTHPEIARKLLEYRYHILDKARSRARVMSENGALFPWRTINGEEASAYFPAGTAQYHINADIAYGIRKYVNASGDTRFLKDYGLEILIETARLWMTLGFFHKPDDSFRINCVTGPDEYTAIVNNNYFTNIMAKNNLEYAAETVAWIKSESPHDWKALASRLSFSEDEADVWLDAAGKMYLPYNEELCIHAQDDSFLQKEPWDFTSEILNKHPLLLNLHPLVIYRYQILKQPDLVLAEFLQGDQFRRIHKIRDYNYYNPITTGDSSLAPCIQSIMAAEISRVEDAYRYFMKTARMDLDDINYNACDGVHIAAMGGTWLSLVYGFGGFRDYDGKLSFCPRLPRAWSSLGFNLRCGDAVLTVRIEHEKAVYSLEPGNQPDQERAFSTSLKINHMGMDFTLKSGHPVEISMKREIKAVIFDLDGVITDTSEFHYLAWKQLSEEKGYTFSREINEKLRGIGRLESLDIILEASDVILSDEERFSQGELKNSYYKKLLKTITPDNILPGINGFIKELKDRRIKIALASASRNAPEVVARLGIEADFDIIMDAGVIEKGKPDPEIFVTAAERLSVQPEYCVGVEDAAAGVVSIKGAGIFAVGIGPAAEDADWAIASTAGLKLDELEKQFVK